MAKYGMALIGLLNTLVTADSSTFGKGLKKAQGYLSSFRKHLNDIGPAIGTTLTAGATVAIGGLTALTASSMKAADDLARDANNIGTTTKALSELQYAAKLSDVDLGTLTGALKKMNVRLAEAAQTGKGATADALKRVGLSAQELTAMSPDQALQTIADKLAEVENPAERASLAVDIFGKSAVDMNAFLAQGGKGIQKLRDEAVKLGVSLDDVDAARINEANDSIDRITSAMQGVGNQLAIQLAPIVTDLAERFLSMGLTGADSGANISTGMEWAVKSVGTLLDVLNTIRQGFGYLQNTVTEVFATIVRVSGTVADPFNLVGVRDSANELADGIQHEADEAWKAWNEDFAAQTPSEQLTKWFDEVKEKSANMTAEIRKAPPALVDLEEEIDKVGANADKFITKLQDEIQTFGMSGREADIFKLQQDGAEEATIEQAKFLAQHLDALEEQEKAMDSLQEKAKSVMADIATPEQQLAEKMKELTELRDKGYLSAFDFQKAEAKATKEILGGAETRLSGLAEFGSQAAAQAIARHRSGGGANDPLGVAKSQLTEQRKQTNTLGKIERHLGNTVVVAF